MGAGSATEIVIVSVKLPSPETEPNGVANVIIVYIPDSFTVKLYEVLLFIVSLTILSFGESIINQ